MTEAVQNSLWTTEHVLFLEVVFKFYLFKFQVLSESSKETWEARSSLWAVDVVFCPFLPKRANKCQRKGPNKRRPKAAASLQFPIRVLWLNFGPPVSCCGVNCILGILKRTARPKIEPPKTSVAYHSRGMCKLTYQYDMEALYLVFWICLFFFARSFIRVNSRVLIQLKKYHWTNHSCARAHTHTSFSLALSLSLSVPWLGRRLLPSQGKTTTTICPEPICGPGTSGPNHWKDGNSRVHSPRTLTTCTQITSTQNLLSYLLQEEVYWLTFHQFKSLWHAHLLGMPATLLFILANPGLVQESLALRIVGIFDAAMATSKLGFRWDVLPGSPEQSSNAVSFNYRHC